MESDRLNKEHSRLWPVHTPTRLLSVRCALQAALHRCRNLSWPCDFLWSTNTAWLFAYGLFVFKTCLRSKPVTWDNFWVQNIGGVHHTNSILCYTNYCTDYTSFLHYFCSCRSPTSPIMSLIGMNSNQAKSLASHSSPTPPPVISGLFIFLTRIYMSNDIRAH
jgi:hypothetical protein